MSVEKNMIVPFAEEQVGRGVVSYGVSSYGYDIRVGDEFKIFIKHSAEPSLIQRILMRKMWLILRARYA